MASTMLPFVLSLVPLSQGDILGLQARAAHLEQLDSQLRPFGQRLGRFAGRFELAQALALIARYL